MKISDLQAQLENIKKEHGDVPVLMMGIKGKSFTSNIIEEVKPIAFPPDAKDGHTQFYVAALLNEEIHMEPYDY